MIRLEKESSVLMGDRSDSCILLHSLSLDACVCSNRHGE